VKYERRRTTLALVLSAFQILLPIVAAIIATAFIGWLIFLVLFPG
jgi:hypothetical protein